MNIFKRIYCRTYQIVLRLALPFLPYREPKILHSVEAVPNIIIENGKKKPLVVTGQSIHALNLTQGLEHALSKSGLPYAMYDKVVANPTTDNVFEALDMFRNEGCDCLISFGGGSPIDCAKCVGALVARPKKHPDELQGILKVKKKIPLLIAVPTTAGTGSETTLACVIVNSQTRRKYAINDFSLIPSYAVLDESVTMSLPDKVVSTTGMDALTHAIEAYIGKSGNRSTRKDALDAIDLIFKNFEESYFQKTPSARKNMLIAAHKAGRAFSKAYVGYVHAVAHSLGGKYDTPHGLANAVILPIVLKEYGKKVHKKLYEIALYCHLANENDTYEQGAMSLIAKIEELNSKFSIPPTLPVKEEDIEELAGYAEHEANPLYPVPVLWDKKKLMHIYRILGGLE